jgi:hypothetical protein
VSGVEIELYHGTDEKWISSILSDGFVAKENRRHWLGNGIYFYTDKALAEWWTTNPSDKFGNNIATPAIIQCTLVAADSEVFDLRSFENFRLYFERFKKFYNTLYSPHTTMAEIEIDKLRCTFFDWLFDAFKYKAIIGTFLSEAQPYYDPFKQDGADFEQLELVYNEVQVCIPTSQQEIIKNKKASIIHGTAKKGR